MHAGTKKWPEKFFCERYRRYCKNVAFTSLKCPEQVKKNNNHHFPLGTLWPSEVPREFSKYTYQTLAGEWLKKYCSRFRAARFLSRPTSPNVESWAFKFGTENGEANKEKMAWNFFVGE